MSKNELSQVFLASQIDVKPNRQSIGDNEHLVIPVIAAKVGVMNGIFYPEDEIKEFVSAWNGVPVPVNHPNVNGSFVSANSPRFEGTHNIGKFYNVNFEDNKLKGEIWINIKKAIELGFESILNSFESGERMEVSTGLYSYVETKSGIFNNENYSGIARHIMPDHLALLPNDIGACSIEKGCGAMRSNKACCNSCSTGGSCESKKLSMNEKIYSLLNDLCSKFDGIMLNKKNSSINDKISDSNMIEKEETQAPKINQEDNEGMEKELLVQEESSDSIEKIEKENLEIQPNKEVIEEKVESKTEEVVEEKIEVNLEQEIESIISNCSSEASIIIKEALKTHKEQIEKQEKEKKDLIESLSSNTEFTKEELLTMNSELLKKLDSAVKPLVNYKGKQIVETNSEAKAPIKREIKSGYKINKRSFING